MRRKRQDKSVNYLHLMYVVIFFSVLLLSIGWAAFQSTFNIKNLYAMVRIDRDIRVTGVEATGNTNSGMSNYEEYNVSSIYSTAYLPNQNSTVTYKVEVTNIGNVVEGIYDIEEIYKIINTNTASDLEIKNTTLTLKEPLCDDTNSSQCKLGVVSTFYVTIGYKANGYDGTHNTHLVTLNFDFRRVFNINYLGFGNTSGLASTIMQGDTKTITFNNTTVIPAGVSVTNANSSYSSPRLTLSNATDDVTITRRYSITYVNFTGDTSGLPSIMGPEGGTITFNSTTGIPEYVLVTGATSKYNSTTKILTLSNITSNVTITEMANGTVEIISITTYDVSNITENNSPQITNNGQSITFDLAVNATQSNYNDDFYIKYAIVIKNDSVYEQKVLAASFTPNITGTGNAPSVNYTITDVNGNPVLNTTIPPKTTETYYLTINVIPQEPGSWGVEGETEVNTAQNGAVTGSILGSTQGDLTGNALAHFTAEIYNTYEENKTFTLSINDSKFSIVDQNGNPISSMSINANSTNTYDFYIKNLNGNHFMASPYDLNVNVTSGDDISSIGVVSLAVNIDPTLIDTTPPVISNVTATITNAEKEILVSWTGYDDNSIVNYYVETYTSNAQGNGTLYHTETLAGGANNATMNYTAEVPNDNAYYYFKVYGKDQSGNIASSQDISACSTSQGYCSRTANERFKWNFVVTLTLTNATSSNGTTVQNGTVRTVTFNVFYDGNINTTLNGSGNDYTAPSSIKSATITYPNSSTSENLPSGNSSQTAYAYNTSTHVLNVYHVKGDINISAEGTYNNTCLAEGTKILLANGKYKNVENIGYDDLLAVWNYDTGSVTYEYPLWIENEHVSDRVIRVTFNDNTYIDFVGDHAIYNSDINMFVNISDKDNFKVGTHVAKIRNNKLEKTTVKSIETIYKEVKYYFVGSTTYYNIFANDILTTDQNLMISNLYGFDNNATWPKEKDLILSNNDNLLDYSYFEDVLPSYLYEGFRVREAGFLVNNNIISLNDFKTYITTLIINPKMLRNPITINNNRYWMVSTSEDNINDTNKHNYLRKEQSIYVLPNSKRSNFIGWYNTSNNKIYKSGDKVVVSHGLHFIALYDK